MIPNGPGACSPARLLSSLAIAISPALPHEQGAGRAPCRLVLCDVAEADYHRPTVCTEFDVTQLADQLIGSVTFLGAAAGSGAGAAPGPGPLETRSAVSIH
jgi:hypothetical protein